MIYHSKLFKVDLGCEKWHQRRRRTSHLNEAFLNRTIFLLLYKESYIDKGSVGKNKSMSGVADSACSSDAGWMSHLGGGLQQCFLILNKEVHRTLCTLWSSQALALTGATSDLVTTKNVPKGQYFLGEGCCAHLSIPLPFYPPRKSSSGLIQIVFVLGFFLLTWGKLQDIQEIRVPFCMRVFLIIQVLVITLEVSISTFIWVKTLTFLDSSRSQSDSINHLSRLQMKIGPINKKKPKVKKFFLRVW